MSIRDDASDAFDLVIAEVQRRGYVAAAMVFVSPGDEDQEYEANVWVDGDGDLLSEAVDGLRVHLMSKRAESRGPVGSA